MFNFTDLHSIHIELTNNCQASCPMCARNYHGGLKNPLIKLTQWTIDNFKTIINQEVLDTVQKIYFCGNFGDPMLHDDLIKICQYIKEVNPRIFVSIHTNGSARKESWWKELAESLTLNHCVHFAIDGLEDTHQLYRIGTNYSTVIKNATAFIQSGGKAEWTFIKFKHNEHQVEECQRIAKELGFEKFMLKNSSRFLIEPSFDVLDSAGKKLYAIEPSTDSIIKFIPKSVIDSYKDVVANSEIDCQVKKNKEIYLDAYGTVMPCCWIGAIPYTYYDDHQIGSSISKDIKSQYESLVNDLGGIEKLNAINGIKQIINSDEWQSIWHKKWTAEDKLITCARVCGKFNSVDIPQPSDQFVKSSVLSD